MAREQDLDLKLFIGLFVYLLSILNFCNESLTIVIEIETLRTEKLELLSPDRTVEVTEVAQAKKEAKMEESGNKRQEDTESIFSAALLPVSFYCDLIKGHSCRAVILAAD